MKKRSIILAGMAVLLLALLLAGCGGNSGESSDDITLEQFNRIETGMDYSEVVAILGRSGELFHEAGVTRVYHWEDNSSSALVTVIFVDGEVNATAQVGLD